jgi:hypothetical protein
MPQALTSELRRSADGRVRQLALLRVALLHSGGVSDICVVRNVSPNGLSARVYRKLSPGDDVEIEFRSGELRIRHSCIRRSRPAHALSGETLSSWGPV